MMVDMFDTVRVRWFPGRGSRLALCVAFAGAISGCNKGTTDKDIVLTQATEVSALRDRLAESPLAVGIIDPRPAARFAAGHLPGAMNINLPAVPTDAKPDRKLKQFEVLVVYGEDPSSASAKAMTKRLISIGYSDVRFMAGGLEEWRARGGEVVVTDK